MGDLKLKILVTGGAGFIGSHLVDALIKKGAEISIIDDLSTGRKENINPQATFYQMDMGDKRVADIFKKEKPEVVFHLAFNTSVPQSIEDPLFDAQGITGSLNIFRWARTNGVKKIIMASSAMVSCKPRSPYAISKLATENYLQFFNQMYNIPIVILRYATVYGPRQVTGAMADYIRKISTGQGGEMYGDGNLMRDYVYIDDITKANLLALDFEGVFSLGSSEETKLNDVHQKIAKLFNKDLKPVYLPKRVGDVVRLCVSYKKAKKELGWQPTVSLDEGLKRTICKI